MSRLCLSKYFICCPFLTIHTEGFTLRIRKDKSNSPRDDNAFGDLHKKLYLTFAEIVVAFVESVVSIRLL